MNRKKGSAYILVVLMLISCSLYVSNVSKADKGMTNEEQNDNIDVTVRNIELQEIEKERLELEKYKQIEKLLEKEEVKRLAKIKEEIKKELEIAKEKENKLAKEKENELAKKVITSSSSEDNNSAANSSNNSNVASVEIAPEQKKEPNNEPSFKANHIYIGGSSMPTTVTSYENLQHVIDKTTYTWVGIEQYSPNDNSGTYFAQHRNTGGEIVLSLSKGSRITVVDSDGNPHLYAVVNVMYNMEEGSEEIWGYSNREYIVLQTSEYRINGNRVGNRIVIADNL